MFQSLRQFDSAVFYYHAAVSIQRAIGDRRGEAISLNNIGFNLEALQQSDSATTYYRLAVPLWRVIGDRSGEATTIINIGRMWSARGQLDSAIVHYRVALQLEREGDHRSAEARILMDIGFVLQQQGRPDSAAAQYRAMLALHRASGDRVGQATALNLIGILFSQQGQGDSAAAHYRDALALYLLAGDQGGEAASLTNLGVLFHDSGQNDSAIVYHRAALRLRRIVGDRDGEATALANIGAVFHALGHPDSAAAYYRSALTLQRARGFSPSASITVNNIGGVFNGLGQRDSALVYYRAALGMFRAAGDRAGEATSLANIGMVYHATGQRDSAIAYTRAALRMHRSAGSRVGEATVLSNLGVVFEALGQRDSARAYYQAALPLRRAVGDLSGLATTLSNLGVVFEALGQRDSAAVYHRAALPIRRATGDRAGEAITLLNIGAVFDGSGQRDSAVFYYRAALRLSRAVGDRAREATTLMNIGVVFDELNQRDSAATYYRAALSLQRAVTDRQGEAATLRNLGFTLIALGQRDSARRTLMRASWLQANVATTAPGDFLRVTAVEDKGLSVASVWARLALSPSGRVSGPAGRTDTVEAWGALERGRGQALRALRRGGALIEDSTFVTKVAASTAAMLTRLARPGRAFVTFDSYRDTLLVLAISPTGTLRAALVPIRTDSLRRLTARIRALVGARGSQRAAVGTALPVIVPRSAPTASFELLRSADDSLAPRALAQAILPPAIREVLLGATEVVLVPDGILSLVPWAALPIDSRGTQLGARVAVRLVPSLTTLDAIASTASSRLRTRPTRAALGTRALIVGDPAMPPGVVSLPGARAEAHWVADTLLAGQGATLLTDRAATVRSVRDRLRTAPLIHFATHAAAFPDAASARGSYLQFAAVDSGAPSVMTVGDLLDAAETERLTLSARLVVLSACETGLGAASTTEGVLGLQRAFLALGAETLLVSLWKVEDSATRALMGAFYRHWLDDADAPSAAESLKRAQSDMRSGKVPAWRPAWARPNAWAAFQVVGAG